MRLPFLFMLLCSLNSFSQIGFDSEKFIVSRNDLETNTFEKDLTANALVIYEYGNSYLDKKNYKLKTEVKRKIKILSEKGFDKGSINIYLYNNKNGEEKVKDIVATTYNELNGEVTKTKLDPANIYTEEYDKNHKIVKFTFPNLKAGSVITYSYTHFTPFMFNFKGWEFQDDIPKLYSEFNTSIPGNYLYNIKLVGTLKLKEHFSEIKKECLQAYNGSYADCSVNKYVMKDIPAFIEEDHITARKNYLSRISFELRTFKGFDGLVNHYTKTWKAVDKELKNDPNIGRQINKKGLVKDLLAGNNLPSNLKQRAEKIFSFVQNNYTWNEKYNLFKDVSIKGLIKNKSGNVSEINILLNNLLNENGIDAKPILLSTRENGLPTKLYPVISEFNYIIVQATIENKTYLLDATNKYLAFGEVAYKALNQYGRILDFKRGSYWVDISASKTSSIIQRIKFDLKDDGSVLGKVSFKKTGYHALSSKEKYYQNPNDFISYYQEEYPDLNILNYSATISNKNDYDFTEDIEVEQINEAIGDVIYFDPFYFKFFTKNPFNLQDRTYPIDFGYRDNYHCAIKLNIPEGYEVTELPESFHTVLPKKGGSLIFNTKLEENYVSVYFKLSFNKAIYSSGYYLSLKKLMNKVVDLQTKSLIVLKKKT